MLMRGRRQIVESDGRTKMQVRRMDIPLRAMVSTNGTSTFSYDTLMDPPTLRLHRAFSDCIEVQSTQPDTFSYQIDFDWT